MFGVDNLNFIDNYFSCRSVKVRNSALPHTGRSGQNELTTSFFDCQSTSSHHVPSCCRISEVVDNLFTDEQNQAKICCQQQKSTFVIDNKVEFSFCKGKLDVIDNLVLVVDD